MNPLHPDPTIAAARQLCLDEMRKPEAKLHVGELEDKRDSWARCCLGHMCAAHGLKKTKLTWNDGRYKCVQYVGADGEEEVTYLPRSLAETLDMSPRGHLIEPVEMMNPRVSRYEGPQTFQSLVAINDTMRWSTHKMADFIEAQMRDANLHGFADGV